MRAEKKTDGWLGLLRCHGFKE